MADAAVDYLIEFIHSQSDVPAVDLDGATDLAATLRVPAPESGRAFDDLLKVVQEGAAKAFNPTGPGYLAFVPGGGLFAAALADFLADGTNRFVNVWNAAPVFAQIEATVVRWLCDLFDYPEDARGILTSGGSMANFSAIVTARKALLPEDFLHGTLYVSTQAHASLAKAAVLAGFPPRNIRQVPVTAEMRIDIDALRRMIDDDRVAGLLPFCVVASAGTTNT
ncbi:MAG: pyridoxal phosphate-dependent decarboxylase family protein, partial [Actinomycetota bacterium]